MSNRKGLTTLILWIFIVIAGSLILLLFFLVASIQAEHAKEKLVYDALRRLDTILATQQGSPDTTVQVPVPQERFKLTCTLVGPEQALLSQIEVGGRSKSLASDLVVGRELSTGLLYLYSKELLLPYDVGNILYVSGPEEILFVTFLSFGSSVTFWEDRFRAELPDLIKDRMVTTMPTSDRYQTIRAVYFLPSSHATPTPDGEHKQYMTVVPTDINDVFAAGTIRYYRYESGVLVTDGTYTYVGFPMLLAFIWQGDGTRGECFAYKLSQRIQLVTKLQEQRMTLLRDRARDAGDTQCEGKLSSMLALTQYQTASAAWEPGTNPGFHGLDVAAQAVAERNEQLLRGVRCGSIY